MNCGIYEIRNTINGHRYIGSAKCFHKRWKWHRTTLRGGAHHNAHLRAAWVVYGEDAFVFRPLIICDPFDLLFYEQRFLDMCRPEYNIATDATAPTRGRPCSPETRAKISAATRGKKRSPETRARMSVSRRGIVMSPETRARMSAAQRGRKKPPRSLETRQRMADAQRGKKRSPEALAKFSAAMRGRKNSPETIAKRALANTGKKRSPESIVRMRAAAQAREARRRGEYAATT